MDQATMSDPIGVARGVHALPAFVPLPGLGIIPVNAFVVEAAEPVLVDTGLIPLRAEFRAALESVIDPAALRWLWLTHTDLDHVGGLGWLLDENPDLRVVTTYLGTGKMALSTPLPMDRCNWVNPGDTLWVGDRELLALKPPTYDAPETTGLFDPHSGSLFTADSLGTLLPGPVESADAVSASALEEGMHLWASIDTPWVLDVDPRRFATAVDGLRSLGAARVLGAHLPVATGMTDALLDMLSRTPGTQPWAAPGQATLEGVLAGVGA